MSILVIIFIFLLSIDRFHAGKKRAKKRAKIGHKICPNYFLKYAWNVNNIS